LDRYLNQRISSQNRSSTRDNPGSFQPQQIFENNPHFIVQQMDSVDQQQQRFVPYQVESDRFREPSPSRSIKSDSYVFNVEGLSSPSWNCERLFNLLCVYGNVLRVCNQITIIHSFIFFVDIS
jgi:hypothetical protein